MTGGRDLGRVEIVERLASSRELSVDEIRILTRAFYNIEFPLGDLNKGFTALGDREFLFDDVSERTIAPLITAISAMFLAKFIQEDVGRNMRQVRGYELSEVQVLWYYLYTPKYLRILLGEMTLEDSKRMEELSIFLFDSPEQIDLFHSQLRSDICYHEIIDLVKKAMGF